MSPKSFMIAAAVVALQAPFGMAANPGEGTACCVGGLGCVTQNGVSGNGTPWCFGFFNGNQEFSQKDADVAKCLVDLHGQQDTACISKSGSSCDINDSQILNVQENRLIGDHKLDATAVEAIKSAIDLAVGTKWDPSGAQGKIEFSQVADNGASVRGVSLRLNTEGDEYAC